VSRVHFAVATLLPSAAKRGYGYPFFSPVIFNNMSYAELKIGESLKPTKAQPCIHFEKMPEIWTAF